ncbi:MAG: GNAT family N-acetyltransferase [Anaerolineae bacterium]|nr:GNAT family N-acetyltransferase [Anaerolineae bacterium]
MEIERDLLSVRAIARADVEPLSHLAMDVLGDHWPPEFIDWKYFANPAGAIYGACGELEGELVGFYGNIPLKLKVGERTVQGCQALDARVAPRARRRGLFVKMAQLTYANMDAAGVQVTYGMPNAISRAGLVNRLGWAYLGEIPRYVKILDAGAVAKAGELQGVRAQVYRTGLAALDGSASRRHPGSKEIEVRAVTTFDARFEALWNQASGGFPVAVARDCAYLTWRYVDNPLIDYVILTAELDGRLTGYVVISQRDLAETGAVGLAEFLIAPGDAASGTALLAEAIRQARGLGAAQLQCWMLPQHESYVRLLKQSGFHYWPQSFVPGIFRHTTSFITRVPEGMRFSPDLETLGNWFLTMGDQDWF